MSDITGNLGLPFMMPNQAQKHVTHNEALLRLDSLVQLVITGPAASPPDGAKEGDCYAIGKEAAGAFEGRAGQLAVRQDGAWTFLAPRRGWRGFRLSDLARVTYDGKDWAAETPPEQMERLGIATPPDDTNRLAVAGAGSLFTHAGAGHRMVLNKKASAETASLLFQTSWSGRAEIGTAGTDELSVKTSADGADWKTALTIDGAGIVRTPLRPVIRAALSTQAFSYTAQSNVPFGMQVVLVQQGGFRLGYAPASNVGKSIVFPVAGLYLVAVNLYATSTAGYAMTLNMAAGPSIGSLRVQGAASGSQSASTTVIARLEAAAELTLLPYGTPTLDGGLGRTEISAMLL